MSLFTVAQSKMFHYILLRTRFDYPRKNVDSPIPVVPAFALLAQNAHTLTEQWLKPRSI